ncbi:hypothetical protein VTN00DRAFT_1791 [Thermoascus crustaceus]|uniref:uncharacterized protein n=1 Tax=Thermoascus crustaceus TaxID=5088 RepID=UPI0037431253
MPPKLTPGAPTPEPYDIQGAIDNFRNMLLTDRANPKENEVPVETVPRPGYNTTGKEVELLVNCFPIMNFPTKVIYQYEVQIGTGAEKRVVNSKVWNSNARKKVLRQMIFDGNRLAWSLINYPQGVNIIVDLDAEYGRPPLTSDKQRNAFRLFVRPTKVVNLATIDAWLRGQMSFNETVLESLNFLDHLLREYPSSQFLAIKRSFFNPKGENKDLGSGVLALKGVYQAIRVANPGRLVVNVDVSNCCFWSRTSLMGACMAILDCRDFQHLIHLLKPIPDGYGGITESQGFYEAHKRIRKLTVQPHYEGCPVSGNNFTVKGLKNGNARTFTIDVKNKATGKKETMSVEQYFKSRYNLRLDYWELPMVEMTKNGVYYPMEVLTIHDLNKYHFKLNEYQTSAMIKYAASRPAERMQSVQKSKDMLAHAKDPVLNAFGLKIEDRMMRTKARLLPNPEIQFGGNAKLNPGVSGRWDLRGKKFLDNNKWPLVAWGVGFMPGKRNVINRTQVEAFVDAFMKGYMGHGGDVSNRPLIVELKEDVAEAVKRLYESTGRKFQRDPQLVMFIVPDKNSFTYLRIKKSCDCRWGVPSQVLQSGHVVKMNPQYISNVLMKVNAKLGGTTARAISKVPGADLRPGSLIIGADVSHSTPGSNAPSMAAVSVCMDAFGGRYFGACETNGERVELISEVNLHSMLSPLIREWMMVANKGAAPKNVYYFRDGVSTGQFSQVLQYEIPQIKGIIQTICDGKWDGNFTVVIANKRHHIRAFPNPNDRNSADRNGNPLPGVLLERDVTSPHEWDFLLYSHIALQGTSRPVHYHVILDQVRHKPHELENMIYNHCYQYMRSTTSVSLFPAVYYAHLVSNRARHHENVPASSGPQSGPEIKLTNPKQKKKSTVTPTLLPIHSTTNRLAFVMWYI